MIHTTMRTKHPYVCFSEYRFACSLSLSETLNWAWQDKHKKASTSLTTSEVPAPCANTCDAHRSMFQKPWEQSKPVIYPSASATP